MFDINRKYRNKLKRVDECFNEIIEEMKEKIREDNPFRVDDWFDQGGIENKDIIFIFACPGKEEFIKEKPCSGQTGENLDIFIKHLEKYLSQLANKDKSEASLRISEMEDKNSSEKIKGKIRYKYVILNSSDNVHFDGLGNGTLPPVKEINKKIESDLKSEEKKNILKNASYIFCFGNEAQKYYEKINKNLTLKAKYIEVCHLSNIALNIKFPNSHDDLKGLDQPDNRKKKRIELLFNDIKSQIT